MRTSLLAVVISLAVASGILGGCTKAPKPIDTTKVFDVESSLSAEYKTQTKGPDDIDPKILGPRRMPAGSTYEPSGCNEFFAGMGHPPKGIRGKISKLIASGQGNHFAIFAVQADKDITFDKTLAQKCQHVDFHAGDVSGSLEETEAPHIDGATTYGAHLELQETNKEGQQASRESYIFTAYFGKAMVEVKADPIMQRGQAPTQVDVDKARELLVDAVKAVRAR